MNDQPVTLSLTDARRIGVRAQLLDADRPTDLVETVRRLTFVQIEHTAPIAPTADLVLWSRLGSAYDPAALTAALFDDLELMELDLLVRPMDDLALFRAEMAEWPDRESTRRWLDDNREFEDDVLLLLTEEGAKTTREIPDTSIVPWPSTGWNNNRNVMMMLENLMRAGRVAVAGRRGRDRLWDLAERVYHADIPTIPRDEATRIRNERRLASVGVVRNKTMDLPTETPRVADAGIPATVEGLKGEWRLDPAAFAALERPFVGRTALLSPFDGLLRDRPRMADLFDFEYALEMYKPAAKRRWGYYALPILHGDQLVGKVDAALTPDGRTLAVHAIHEDAGYTAEAAEATRAELEALAEWLGVRLSAG